MSWLRDAAIKNGSALPGPTTSGMRNFGACRGERRPAVRFCGIGVAAEDRAWADEATSVWVIDWISYDRKEFGRTSGAVVTTAVTRVAGRLC
jgi:hypothetical protein